MRIALVIALFLMSYSIKAPTYASSYAKASADKEASAGRQDQKVIDSCKAVIEQGKHDTLVCDAYMSWANLVYLANPDTALTLVQKVAELAKQNLKSDPPLDGNLGTIKKRYLTSLAEALNNIGYIYNNQGDVPNALEYFHKSLKIREELGDKGGIASSINSIGVIYMHQGDTTKALDYVHRSLIMQEEIGDQNGIAYSLTNIGYLYDIQGDIPKALEYNHKSLKIREELGDKRGVAESLNNIGNIYDHQGDIRKALEYYYKSFKIDEELGNKSGTAISLMNIGNLYLEDGQLNKAEIRTTDALNISLEIGSPEKISLAAMVLSKVYKKLEKWSLALDNYELHIQMRDSIKNEETQKATIRQQTKYEFEKAQLVKEQEEKEAARIVAEETSRRDNLQYSIILIAILVLFGGVLSLGFINVSERVAEGIIFFSFLILFEFLLVLADPYIDTWSGGAPGIKLLFNASIAALIFPAHAFFESRLKSRLMKSKT